MFHGGEPPSLAITILYPDLAAFSPIALVCDLKVLEAFQRVQFLAASKGEAHVNIERSLMAFKALRDQMNAQWGITVSVSTPSINRGGGEVSARATNGS